MQYVVVILRMVFRRIGEVQARLLSSNKIYEGLICGDDVFEKILKVFDFDFVYDEVKDCYCLDNGRPCEDPVRLFKASLVQRSEGKFLSKRTGVISI